MMGRHLARSRDDSSFRGLDLRATAYKERPGNGLGLARNYQSAVIPKIKAYQSAQCATLARGFVHGLENTQDP